MTYPPRYDHRDGCSRTHPVEGPCDEVFARLHNDGEWCNCAECVAIVAAEHGATVEQTRAVLGDAKP